MKTILTALAFVLYTNAFSQKAINIKYNEKIHSFVITSKQNITRINYGRMKAKKYIDLKSVQPLKKRYVIPNRYFKYQKIRVSVISGNNSIIQDFITKSKRQ